MQDVHIYVNGTGVNAEVIHAATESFDISGYTAQMNTPYFSMVNIGQEIINKNAIQFLTAPVLGSTPNVNIVLNNGTTVSAYAENYNGGETTALFNDQAIAFVQIGDVTVNKNMVKRVSPIA